MFRQSILPSALGRHLTIIFFSLAAASAASAGPLIDSRQAQVAVSLEGVDIAGDEIVDFGVIDPGQVTAKTFTIRNLGPGSVTFVEPIFVDGSAFRLSSGPPAVIAQGGTGSFTVEATGAGLGTTTSGVAIAWQGAESGFRFSVKRRVSNRIKLFFKGKQIGFDEIVDYGRIAAGEKLKHSFKLKNNGSDEIRLGGSLVIDGSAFELPNTPGATIAPGAARWFAIRTTGTGLGLATSDITIDYADNAATPMRFQVRRIVGPLIVHNESLESEMPFNGSMPIEPGLWQMAALERGSEIEIAQGSFSEVSGSRFLLQDQSGQLPDGRAIAVRLSRVVGTLTDVESRSSAVSALLFEVVVDGQDPIWFMDGLRTEANLNVAMEDTALLFEAAARAPGIQLSSTGGGSPPNAAGSGLPPIFQPGGCDNPGALDSCGFAYCQESQNVIDAWLSAAGTCSLDLLAALLSCGCTTFGGPVGVGCATSCILSSGLTAQCIANLINSLPGAMADLNQIKEEAECCYCANFAEYAHLCNDCEGLPIRARVDGLMAGETVKIRAECIGGAQSLDQTVVFDGSQPFQTQEIIVCPPGFDYHLYPDGRVDAPGVAPSSERNCSPGIGFEGTLPNEPSGIGFTGNFNCTCSNAVNCPRIGLEGHVSDIPDGVSMTVTASVSGESFPDYLVSRSVSSNGPFGFVPSGVPGGEIGFVQITSGGAGCEIEGVNIGVPLTGPPGTIVRIANITCDEDGDPPPGCETAEAVGVPVGFTADFVEFDGTAGTGNFTAVLETCQRTQEVSVTGPASYQFPLFENVGNDYELTLENVSPLTICEIENGIGTIADPVGAIAIECIVPGQDTCVTSPQSCIQTPLPPECDLFIRFEHAVVTTTGQAGETIGSHTTIFIIFDFQCSGPGDLTQTTVDSPYVQVRTVYDDPVTGDILIRGIARDDEEGVTSVTTYIDGQQVQLGGFAFGQPDPWTCSEIPSAICNPNSGFSGILNPTALGLSTGSHTLLVKAVNGNPGLAIESVAEWHFNVGATVDEAQLVSHTLPSSMVCGDTQNVSVTMRNTGTSSWSQGSGFELRALGNQDPFTSTIRWDLPSGTTIAPGDQHTFSWTMTAPANSGNHLSDWQMLHSGVGFFGDRTIRTVTVSCDAPEIRVETRDGLAIANGDTYDYGDVETLFGSVTTTFDICNDGTGDLVIDQAWAGGQFPGFYLDVAPAPTVAPQSCTSLDVRFWPNFPGEFTGWLEIHSNDTDEDPFVVDLVGFGTIP